MKKPSVRVEAAFRADAETRWKLLVNDASLLASSDYFVRLDLYPLVTPMCRTRHYGFVDVPLAEIREESTEILLDWGEVTTLPRKETDNRVRTRSWKGRTSEPGYFKLHCSLWKGRGGPESRMLETNSTVHFLPDGTEPVALKQINIPLTDRCNLKCTMCPRQKTDDLVEIDIKDEVLSPLLEACADMKCVLLQGLGEPLLFPGVIELAEDVKERLPRDGEVGVTTNATLMDDKVAKGLLASGIDFIYFSVDSAFRETYEKIRLGADFDRVKANIERCAELRAKGAYHGTRFMMNCVVMEENWQELPEFVRLSNELGVENIAFSHCIGSEGSTIERSELEGIYERCTELGHRLQINIECPPAFPLKDEHCLFMERAVLLSSGEVLPCHAMAPGYRTAVRHRIFGNVKETSLQDIWHNEEYRNFRERVIGGDFPVECTGCPCKAFQVP